jgi:predicted MFS family arabinose efflux permease
MLRTYPIRTDGGHPEKRVRMTGSSMLLSDAGTYVAPVPATTAWSAVLCMSLLTFVLVASEFMPVSLLTPIADQFGVTEGQAGQAIAISGFFAIVTSLFGNTLLSRFDRRTVVLLYTGVLVASGLLVALASDYLTFMAGRALVGVAIGGFWSLSTAILARLSTPSDLPKTMAMLQGGTALASVLAAPLGSFLGGLIGWRGAFFIVVPAGIMGLVWQCVVIPRMPPEKMVSAWDMVGLFRNRIVALGMAAAALAFMGQFALTTYLRPYLENVTGLSIDALSLVLLGLGIGGLCGTAIAGFTLRRHLKASLVGIPLALAFLSVCLVAFGEYGIAVVGMLFLWGAFSSQIPVAWGTWMTRVIPSQLEAGGGLQVALIQLAITAGATSGGLFFDAAGWWSAFLFAGAVLIAGAVVASVAGRSMPSGALT